MSTILEHKEKLRAEFVKSLKDKLSEPVYRASVHLKGELKKKFIHDMANNLLTINKHLNAIVKYYYDHNKP